MTRPAARRAHAVRSVREEASASSRWSLLSAWLRTMRLLGWPLDGPPPPGIEAKPTPSPKRTRKPSSANATRRGGDRARSTRAAKSPVESPTLAPLGLGPTASPTVPDSIRALPTVSARYEALARWMVEAHGLRVRRWRRGTSGLAWEISRSRGVERWIEAPYPKGPVSCAVFLHEVGHHSIGLGKVSPRCLEEFHAWRWAIEGMEAAGIPVAESVTRRMHASLRYAVAKAERRGLRRLPAELAPFRPVRRVKR
ncbi:MAG: hypothetical protein ACO3EP_02620 [Phycisphaerales bacterium]|jgi:hypothetical protein